MSVPGLSRVLACNQAKPNTIFAAPAVTMTILSQHPRYPREVKYQHACFSTSSLSLRDITQPTPGTEGPVWRLVPTP